MTEKRERNHQSGSSLTAVNHCPKRASIASRSSGEGPNSSILLKRKDEDDEFAVDGREVLADDGSESAVDGSRISDIEAG